MQSAISNELRRLQRRRAALLAAESAAAGVAGFLLTAAAARWDGLDPLRGGALAAGALSALALAAIWVLLCKPGLRPLARNMDRLCRAEDRLATALEISLRKETPSRLESLCLAQAESLLSKNRSAGFRFLAKPAVFLAPLLALGVFALAGDGSPGSAGRLRSSSEIAAQLKKAERLLLQSAAESEGIASELRAAVEKLQSKTESVAEIRKRLEPIREKLLAMEKRRSEEGGSKGDPAKADSPPDGAEEKLARAIGAIEVSILELSASASAGEEKPVAESGRESPAAPVSKIESPDSRIPGRVAAAYRWPARYDEIVKNYFGKGR